MGGEIFSKGFHASLFESTSGTYKISYRGTDGGVDWWTNILMGLDLFGPQIEDAINFAEFALGTTGSSIGQISFTGHSLGGALAALMAVFYDREAVVFAPGPYGTLIDDIYLTLMTRFPSKSEQRLLRGALGRNPDTEAVTDLLWALSMTPEFFILR